MNRKQRRTENRTLKSGYRVLCHHCNKYFVTHTKVAICPICKHVLHPDEKIDFNNPRTVKL